MAGGMLTALLRTDRPPVSRCVGPLARARIVAKGVGPGLAKDRSPARPIVPVLHGGDARGRRRIQAELVLLGHEVAELTIARYMHRPSPHVARLAHRARPRARRYHRYQRVT